MCVTVDTRENNFLCIDHSLYQKEIELFHELKEKLLKKVEKNEPMKLFDKGNNFKEFKESLKTINHQNLKK